ncbi:RES domain-containing protein [Saccharibacter sp. 17.LH.SD]|uniref:RES family NAD+ phosphorylase n=1 Tax=Saccharibacter sp. 17.LH.SD TaxID=2689393 RepID=UPI001371E518|nr:RES family NAD+ phosphorylase [Saccharibacter sp. 17.LH.SD]MXV44697.1 RES domain-containing protein [Saccharibacter sp. 17.LH.SD]
MHLKRVSGLFFRIMRQQDPVDVLQSVTSPVGRYHHDGQAAIYMSSRPDWAFRAIESYIRPNDPPRFLWSLELQNACVIDMRDKMICEKLGLKKSDSDMPWKPQIQQGIVPYTWKVSDKARDYGADGLIYTARSNPARWHIVIFKWNSVGSPTLRVQNTCVRCNF